MVDVAQPSIPAMSTDDGPARPDTRGRHTLGPHVVGQRIVVRRVLPGETGPSGGPALTDVLGVCESWADGLVGMRREDGTRVSIETRDIVSGKPVPPRPSVLTRVSPQEVERRAARQLRPRETSHLGDWLLRCTGGSTGRSNSVLPLGDPGLPFDRAAAHVQEWYAARERPAWAQVVVDSDVHQAFAGLGWVPARPDEADASVLVASLPQARRRLRPGPGAPEVHRSEVVSREWLTGNPRALDAYDAIAHQLQTDEVVFVSVVDEGGGVVRARGRATYDRGWIGITDVWVEPGLRRTGLARAVMADLLAWGAERGAGTVLLQVLEDNAPALALYDGLGFRTHHAYRYLTAPAAGRDR